jgi:dipeptidase D
MPSTTDATALETLEPKSVWRFFAGIAATPRPSKHEEQVRAHTRRVAEQHGLTVREDPTGNMVIEAPASPGCETAPTIVLQGHFDMVPEKDADVPHDFEQDPIPVRVEQDPQTGRTVVTAAGTTLGADNGIGMALALAAATEPDLRHGPLELLNTVDEEAGMTGAKALAPDFFKGKILINLDSEEDNAIYIGCAGGCDTTLTWQLKLKPCAGNCRTTRVTVSGLRGGHSGGDIHENRGNANKVLARVLNGALRGLRLAEIRGGSKRNVIPREASALVCGSKRTCAALEAAARTVRGHVAAESNEPDLKIAVEPAGNPAGQALSPADTRRLVAALVALPHGVHGMHRKVPNLVETSNNVGVIASESDGDTLKIELHALSRSSSQSLLHATRDQIEAVGKLAGAHAESGNEYPGWEPNPDSPTLATCRRIYRELFGEEAHVAAIHAGLECGIINERMGNTLDTVSFGPTITGAHSPDERVYVDSVAKSWTFLKAVLAELAKP